MGTVCSKVCPWLSANGKSSALQEVELDDKEELTADYKMLNGENQEENQKEVKDVDEVQINISSLILERNCPPSELYDLIENLGSGAYGTVCKVRHKEYKELRAMKIIKKENLIEGVKISQIEQEINILKRLDHPNVLKIYEFFQDDENFYLVTELCGHGDLSDKLQRMGCMNEIPVKVLMYQILSSVAYLHSKGVIHGDLKLENILIESLSLHHRTSFNTSITLDVRHFQRERGLSEGPRARSMTSDNHKVLKHHKTDSGLFKNMSNYEIKLIDFGCSKLFSKGRRKLSGLIGTSFYCSPEVLKDQYNEKCDIWACGVIMYLLLCGSFPFEGETDEEIEANITKGKFNFNYPEFEDVSQTAKDLIINLLTYNPDERISASQALNHPFFKLEINPKLSFKEDVNMTILTQLKSLKNSNKFKQAVITYITHNYANKEEVQQLRKLFKFLDKNDDGTISKEELLEGYHEFEDEISEENLNIIIKAIDNDGNGFIEYEEFIRASLDKEKLLNDTNLKLAFDLFDIDKNGSISCEEIKNIIFKDKQISEQVEIEFMAQINKKVTDYITFEEFKELIKID